MGLLADLWVEVRVQRFAAPHLSIGRSLLHDAEFGDRAWDKGRPVEVENKGFKLEPPLVAVDLSSLVIL